MQPISDRPLRVVFAVGVEAYRRGARPQLARFMKTVYQEHGDAFTSRLGVLLDGYLLSLDLAEGSDVYEAIAKYLGADHAA